MAEEYKLSHTASEIDRKLSEIDNLGKVKTVNGKTPDENGNVIVETGEVSDEQIEQAVEEYLTAHPIEPGGGNTTSSISGYSGIVYENGVAKAYNPLVNTIADNMRATKLSAYLQHYAGKAGVISTPDVVAHESSYSKDGMVTWVENVAGTTADIPSQNGITAVRCRRIKSAANFPKPENTPAIIESELVMDVAKQGDEAINTLTGETFTIQGGVGYQTNIDGNVLCGYVPGYGKLAGMTVPVWYGSIPGVGWRVQIGERKTWTLSIDGTVGEYNYNRLSAPANTAVLHPSNQVCKIGSTYYRADIVPADGFVLVSSTDLINWVYVDHVSLPEVFVNTGLYEVCLGEKNSRMYAAIRQNADTGVLYLCKLTSDLTAVNTIVSIPDASSKPYFCKVDNNNLLLATAPVDRYSCKVYNILDDFHIVKIVPLFEVVGIACNYPHVLGNMGWLYLAGTNGPQTNKKGVSVLPCIINAGTLVNRAPAETDVLLLDSEKEILFGNIYELPFEADLVLTDRNTGIKYKLSVVDSKLTMDAISEVI